MLLLASDRMLKSYYSTYVSFHTICIITIIIIIVVIIIIINLGSATLV